MRQYLTESGVPASGNRSAHTWLRIALAIAACLSVAGVHADDENGVLRKMSDNKFVTLDGLPSCVTAALQSGDPAKGASLFLFKTKAGCLIPWHWHTPTETLMMVSGTVKLEMKDHGASKVLGAGGYAKLPGKHVHQFRCTAACTGFVSSDTAFDIHYVDKAGNEISPQVALSKSAKSSM